MVGFMMVVGVFKVCRSLWFEKAKVWGLKSYRGREI